MGVGYYRGFTLPFQCGILTIRQFGMILVYIGSTELWKWGKRVWYRRKVMPAKRQPGDKTLRMEKTIGNGV